MTTTITISQVLTQLKFLESESEADHVMRWQPLGGNRINMTLEGPVGGTAEATVNGTHVVGGPGVMAMNPLSWISPDEADVIRNRKKEPVAAPEVHYVLSYHHHHHHHHHQTTIRNVLQVQGYS